MHFKDCSQCKRQKYTSGAHDRDKKVDIKDNDDVHDTYCEVCWGTGHTDETAQKGQYQGTESHEPWDGGEEPTKHFCPACNHQMVEKAKQFHCFGGLSNDYVTRPFYTCNVCDADASLQNGTYSKLHITGLPESKYVASDASITMEPIPEFPHATYDLYWTVEGKANPTLRDGAGNKVSPKINPADVAIESWGRKNLKTHATKSADYAKETYDAQMALNGYAVIGSEYFLTSEEDLYRVTDMINSDINRASDHEKEDWNGVLHELCRNVYRNGYTYEPTITQNGTRYELTFSHPAGGWAIPPNMFMAESHYLQDALFKYGKVEMEPAVPWVANIYYCYRVKGTGEIPKNGYKTLYTYGTVTVYNSGPKNVTVSIPADMKLIDRTGYRYAGVATQVSAIGNIRPASAPTSSSSVGTVTVGWDYNRAAAIVTFFVEPVLCSWNQYAVNYNGDEMKINTTSHQGSGLEFPDYYDKSAGKCYIPLETTFKTNVIEPLESLHKFAWPGYILRKSAVYADGTNNLVAGSSVKTYNDEQTTQIDGSGPGYVINERIPSYYDEETDGYAVDKNFRFFYNTPTIDIEHKKYGTNEYMKSVTGKDIKYKQQIVNQYAYIDSLITDNVKDTNYVMSVSTATGAIETFEYKYPRYDLVQVKIYEVKDGKQTHYATLYVDEDYKDGNKSCLVKNYQGIFEKYYSESLIAIAEQVSESLTTQGRKNLFNTNTNWKVEFIYDEVERVYIQFKDLKGNSIYIEEPAGSGKYIGQITSKIPRVDPYTYTPKDLGANGRFKLVQYTERTDRFEQDHKKDLEIANPISGGTTVSVPPNTGDRYIIFYYLTGKMITVEYRDLNDNTIKAPETMEIPVTGVILDVPDINLYEIKGYTHNPDYDNSDPNNIPGETKKVLPTGEEVFVIDGTLRPLTVDDKEIGIPNPEEKSHHVIIYYESKEALKVEYRDMENNPIQVPPQYESQEYMVIPETGTKVVVPKVPGYIVKVYQHNPNYNGTDTMITGPSNSTGEGNNIPVHSNGNNQFIIIYYEKVPEDSKVRVEFKEDIPTAPDIKEPIEMDIPSDEETPIYVPDIPEYIPVDYDKDGTPDLPIPEDKTIEVIGDPDNPIKIIIWYKKTTTPDIPEIPTIITPDDNLESAYLRANRQYTEEYETEVAIPTSEDLYVSGDVYDYRLVTKIEPIGESHKVNVTIRQPYYTTIGSEAGSGTKDYIELKLDDVEILYNYYHIEKAELYDLKSVKVENGAIKYYNNYNYDTDTAGEYIEGEANYKVVKNTPYLVYEVPEKKASATDNNARIQIRSNDAYTVDYVGGRFVITINDVDYYNKEDMSKTKYENEVENQLRNEAEAIIEKCTQIKIQKLTVNLKDEVGTGESVVEILTGEKYYLPKKSEVLSSTDYYIPYVAGRAPLYSFYHDKDLYVREEAENRYYPSTVAGDYRLIESIENNTKLATIEAKKLAVEKITINPINVHTPIINKVTLEPSEINEKSVQLVTQDYVTKGTVNTNPTIVLNLEERFTIKIPNAGDHIAATGYGNGKAYNHGGLTANAGSQPEIDATPTLNGGKPSRIEPKSEDVVSKEGILDNRKTEKEAVGPSFAEYKLVKFPYDVYLISTDAASPAAGKPQLFKANEWYNLYEYVKPSIDSYEFAIPTWVKDATGYVDGNGIHVLVVAENCSLDTLKNAMENPMTVKTAIDNKEGKNTTYILRTSFNTYVSGRLYDLQIRDTDDVAYMNKIKPALTGKGELSKPTEIKELPLGQEGQLPAYRMGLKLGYRFYFDLKTKGISNKDIIIKPKIYYVSADGKNVTDDISLFYHTKGTLYNKLDNKTPGKDLNIRMTMAGTHGIINNPGYTGETISAKQLDPKKVYTNQVVIGRLIDGLKLVKETQKLPFDNIAQVAKICGFETNITDFIASAVTSESINDDVAIGGPNDIKNATGHWYGEYYLPASTVVVAGSETTREQVVKGAVKPITTGYLVVVFEKITTEDDVNDENSSQPGYLTYSSPSEPEDYKQQWEKEGIETIIVLPNGVGKAPGEGVKIPTSNILNAGPMAIYQVNLRANNDFETEGTH